MCVVHNKVKHVTVFQQLFLTLTLFCPFSLNMCFKLFAKGTGNLNFFFFCSSSLQLLLSKLEKNKAMKAEDKAKCMKTLSMLIKSISKLQEEIKGMSSTNSQQRAPKSKTQVFTCLHQEVTNVRSAFCCCDQHTPSSALLFRHRRSCWMLSWIYTRRPSLERTRRC